MGLHLCSNARFDRRGCAPQLWSSRQLWPSRQCTVRPLLRRPLPFWPDRICWPVWPRPLLLKFPSSETQWVWAVCFVAALAPCLPGRLSFWGCLLKLLQLAVLRLPLAEVHAVVGQVGGKGVGIHQVLPAVHDAAEGFAAALHTTSRLMFRASLWHTSY